MCEKLPVNCTTANTKGQCTQCDEGFVVTNGECTIQQAENPNCAEQNSKGECI